MFIAPTTLPEGANIRRTLSDSSGTSDTLRSETGSVAHGPQRERDLEKGIKPSDDAKVPTKVKGTTKKAVPGQIGEQASVPIAGTAKPKRDATKKTRQADDAKVAKKAKSPSKTAGQEHNEKRKPAVRAPGVAAAGPMSPKRESGGPPGKPGAPAQEDDPFLVTIKGREHLHPHSWGSKYRWFLTCFGGLMVLNATFASTGPSQLIPSIDAHFGVSEEVGLLTISLFVLGYCVGPAFWVNRLSLVQVLDLIHLFNTGPLVRTLRAKKCFPGLMAAVRCMAGRLCLVAKYWCSPCISIPEWMLCRCTRLQCRRFPCRSMGCR